MTTGPMPYGSWIGGHSTEHLSAAAQAVFGAGTAQTSEGLGGQLKELKHGDPEKVLNGLRGLRDGLLAREEGERDGGALKLVTESLGYLEKRRDQIRYAEFMAAGLPIGSGAVESGNKRVVEFRLKGSGMHWAREHVNPMVALRNVVCSDRWDEAWAQIVEQVRQEAKERAEQRRIERAAAKAAALEPDVQPLVAVEPIEKTAPVAIAGAEPAPIPRPSKPAGSHHRPAANHPWRRMPIGRARAAT